MAKYTEEEYREAAKIWKSQNPNMQRIPVSTKIEISNGKIIPIGVRITNMRSHGKSLDEEQQEFWKDYGVFEEKRQSYTEEEYREAAKIWKSQNPNMQRVPRSTKIEISNGKIIPIGERIITMRRSGKSLDEEQQEFWKDYGVFEEKRQSYTEEEYREAAKIWKSQNPNMQRIPVSTKIEISNGKIIPIGVRITNMRSHGKSLDEEQQKFWKDYGVSEEKQSYTEEEYREAAKIWKSQNPNMQRVPRSTKIEISNGKIIPIGERIITMRRSGKSLDEEQQEFWKDYGLFYQKQTNIENPSPKQSSLDKYIELFDGDKEKALRVNNCVRNLRERRKSKKKQVWNIDNILKEFDVDLETLKKYLSKTKVAGTKSKTDVLEYDGRSLRSFCIENGYNYDVIVRAIKLHDMCSYDTLEQLINRSLLLYNRKGQNEPATWIYEKYGNLVKHILLYLKLDSTSILRNMTNYTITLEEAIRHDVFKRNIDKKENSWLEELYNYLIEEVDDKKNEKQIEDDIAYMFMIVVQEYNLTSEEMQELWRVFEKYINVMREYLIVDVGLEVNPDKKLEKIRKNHLDAYEIEESFFVPLKFDKGVLIGRRSELYKRRQLLRQYIIDWDYYTELEKETIRKQNNFTEEELSYINKTREEINEVIVESSRHM